MLCGNLPAPHSSHTLNTLPATSRVVLWRMETCAPTLGVPQTLSSSCTQNKPGLSRQEHSVFITPHEKLCWSLQGTEQPGLNSTAEAKWHKTSWKLSSPKSHHKPQPIANGSRYSSAEEIRFHWKPGNTGRLGSSASSSLAPRSGCSRYSSEGSDCQAQL